MNIRVLCKVNGLLLMLLSLSTVVPLWLAIHEEEDIRAWIWTGSVFLCVGGLLYLIGRSSNAQRDLGIREGIATTSIFWTIASLIAALAIWLDVPNTSFMQAWFEGMSGLTTTGSTIFGEHYNEFGEQVGTPIEKLPASILFWRALLQWFGGIGIVVISIALIPLLMGGSGFQLYRAEIPGLSVDRLAPRLATTARLLLGIYCGFTVCMALALRACGVPFFDAVCHAMTCIATGGYSTFDNSIEGLGSHTAEWIIIGGMFLGALNFALLIQCIRGKPLVLWRNVEARSFFYMVLIAWFIIAFTLKFQSDIYDGQLHDLMRDSLFQVVSIASCTGYGTGYDTTPEAWWAWPQAAIVVLVICMLIGGCAGSTSGGIKMARILVIFKSVRREMRRYMEPNRVTPITLNNRPINDRIVSQVNAFIFLYFVSLALGTLGFCLLGNNLTVSFSASLSALSNIGPALDSIGPSHNFRGFNDGSLMLSIFMMLLGRLELLTVLMSLHPRNWQH